MLKTRIIPCLLLHDEGLVKTIKFKNPRYIGDPINAVRIFNDKEVDELIFLDIDASKYKRPPNFRFIEDLATECFMPFAYGGGITTLEQIESILRIGVEKVVLNHHALSDLSFVQKAANHFGSSTIIGAIDVKKDLWGNYKVYDHVSKSTLSETPLAYSHKLQQAGVGEIFLNNVDRDGTYAGLDLQLIQKINNSISVPLVVCGGASSLHDIQAIISQTKISAVAAGSLFVYQGTHRAVLISYPQKSELKSLFS